MKGFDTSRGTLVNPYLRGIYDGDGVLISGSWNEDGGTGNNSRVVFTPDEAGTYYVSAESAAGRTGTYALSVTEGTDDFSADTSTTGQVSVGGSVTGEIELFGDRDWFAVTLEAGKSYVIDLEGSDTGRGTLPDPYLVGIYDANGDLISGTNNDDGGLSDNSRIVFTPDEGGTYYVSVGESVRSYSDHVGTYTLSVEEVRDLDGTGVADEGVNGGMPGALGYLFQDDEHNAGEWRSEPIVGPFPI